MKRQAPRPKITLVFAALAALLGSGCFSYVPAELATVPAGENVRLFVTRDGMAPLADLPITAEQVVRGQLVSHESAGIFLRIPITSRQEGFHSTVLGQDVLIPTAEILQVERRRVNKVATGGMVAASAGAAITIIAITLKVIDQSQPGPGEEEEQMRLPLFSFVFR